MLWQPEVTKQTAPVAPAIFKSAPIPSETSSKHFLSVPVEKLTYNSAKHLLAFNLYGKTAFYH